MPQPDQPSIELRLPEKPPEPRDLTLSVQEVRRLLQGESLTGPLLENQESRPSRKEGEPRERVPKTEQPSIMEVEQRAVEMEQNLFRSIVDRTNVNLRTAIELAESRATMQRMQAWSEVDGSFSEAGKKEQNLLTSTVELDRLRTIIQYQEALIHDFLNVVDRYVAYVQKPEGAALRKDATHAEKEKKVAAMLEELKQILPLLSRLTQVRYYETMLEEDGISATLSGLKPAELATKLDALKLPAKTGETETENFSLSELARRYPDNRELQSLLGQLPPILQNQSLGKLHVILHNPGDYRTLEKQINNPDLSRRIAGGGTLRGGLQTHVRNLRGEIAKGSRRFALQIPKQTTQGANEMEQKALDLLNRGVTADASEEESRNYADVLEKRMRDMFRVGEPWEMADEKKGERESRVANSLYLGIIMERREQLFNNLMERKEGELPNLAKLAELHDLYMQEIAETVAYHKEELRLAGDLLSLLYTQRHIGPGTRPREIPRFINRLNARERAALERTIGAPLMRELEDEGQIYSEGLDGYITAIEKACDRHNTFWKNFKEEMVLGLDEWSKKLEQILAWFHGLAWFVPDITFFEDKKWSYGGLVRWAVKKTAGEGWVIEEEKLRELIGEWKGEIQSMKHTIETFEKSSEPERESVRADTRMLRQLHMGIPSKELALTGRELDPNQIGAVVMSETFSFIPEELKEGYRNAKGKYDAAMRHFNEGFKKYCQEVLENPRMSKGIEQDYRNAYLAVQRSKGNPQMLQAAMENLRTAEMELKNVYVREGEYERNQLSEAMARYQSINEQIINLYFNNYYLSLAENPKSGVPDALKEHYRTVRQELLSAKEDPKKLREAMEKLRGIECEIMKGYIRSAIQNYTEAKQAAEAAKGTPQEEQAQAKLYVWKQRAATAYLRILEDLQVHDLPGLTGEVEKLMNSLGEKVGKHAERFRQLQIMESAAWSTGIGAITTITEPFVLCGILKGWGLIRGPLGAPGRWGAKQMGRAGWWALRKGMTPVNHLVSHIDEAMKLRGAARAARLAELAKNPMLREAAELSDDALRLQRAAKAAQTSRAVTSGLVTVGIFIDLYLMYDNRQRISDAEKRGDFETARILKKKEISLALGGVGGAATFGISSAYVAGPLALALGAGVMYSDMLYEHAIELSRNEEDYRSIDSGTLLEQARRLTNDVSVSEYLSSAVTGRGAETRQSRTRDIYRAYIRRNTPVPVTDEMIENAEQRFATLAPASLDQWMKKCGSREEVIRSFIAEKIDDQMGQSTIEKEEYIRAATGLTRAATAEDFHVADAYAALSQMKRDYESGGLSPVVEYATGPEKTETIDFSDLPDLGENPDASLGIVRNLAQQYERYQLAQVRTHYLVLGETLGWEKASEFARNALIMRLHHEILAADCRIGTAFSSRPANAVRFQFWLDIRKMYLPFMQVLMNTETNMNDIQSMLGRMEGMIRKDPKAVYDSLETRNMMADNFSPLKYALNTFTYASWSSAENARMHEECVVAAEQSLARRAGVPDVRLALVNLAEQR
ncbi:hypothetical protein COU79_01280 [Candidatus Peregrinibacteria bacterium CG10_big_fil_rev_8_21_14_0_10_54_7]|nr:MAG: hypothetical protein COU79_01280 [Candidatus Peregrinibacteria bacterium CG10_big_fil_rev_8_21_14_0_10_54_7]